MPGPNALECFFGLRRYNAAFFLFLSFIAACRLGARIPDSRHDRNEASDIFALVVFFRRLLFSAQMNPDDEAEVPMDMRAFIKNRSQFSPTALEQYAGKYVAWCPDGKRIVTAAEDPLALVAALKAAGYDPAECVLSSIPANEEVVLGGGLDE